MGKRLFIIRHAEAENFGNSTMLKDFDRNLTGRGISQSAKIGRFLKISEAKIDVFVSSSAARAFQTAKFLLEQFNIEEDSIQIDENLYGGGPRAYLSCINRTSESLEAMAIFGHNPDISFFAEYLTSDDIQGSMRKATIIELNFEELTWKEVSSKSGSMVQRIDVKELDT
jgi:phosphohistidine phosphatase